MRARQEEQNAERRHAHRQPLDYVSRHQCVEEHTEPKRGAETRVPFSLEQIKAKQEERHAAKRQLDRGSSDASGRKHNTEEVSKDSEKRHMEEGFRMRKARKKSPRPEVTASGSSFDFSRALQGTCVDTHDYLGGSEGSEETAEDTVEPIAETQEKRRTQGTPKLDLQTTRRKLPELRVQARNVNESQESNSNIPSEAEEEAVLSAYQTDQKQRSFCSRRVSDAAAAAIAVQRDP